MRSLRPQASPDTISNSERELLFNYLKESYEAGNFVSDKSLNSIVPRITYLHKRHHLQNIFKTLEKDPYFLKYKYTWKEGEGTGYEPINENSKKRRISKLSSRLLLIHFRESYESNSFVSHESLSAIVPGVTSRDKHHCLRMVLDILSRENGYFFKYESSPEKGYRPVNKKINYIASLIAYFKKAYESDIFIKYEDIKSIGSDYVTKRNGRTQEALKILKNQYGYIFQNVPSKGYHPITDAKKRFCRRCEKVLPVKYFQKKESSQFTVADAKFFGSCKNCHKKYTRQYQRDRRKRAKEAIAST